MTNFALIIDLIARGGGGGSSGGSGGSGGGGLLAFIFLVGYAPMHGLGWVLQKFLPKVAASLIGWPVALVLAIIACFFGWWGWIIAAGVLVGIGAGLYGWFNKIGKLAKQAKEKQALAASKDTAWNEENLRQTAAVTFANYQYQWSMGDSASMQSYMTPWYFYHNQLMVSALQQIGRKNIVGAATIASMQLTEVNDAEDNARDSFVMHIQVTADDQLYETATNELLFRDTKPFSEFWRFERSSEGWRLAGITQATENPLSANPGLQQFANANQYCYSPDWGWLLLPKRGQLFDKASFGTSDINNHVIGMYETMLVQLYNYVPSKSGTTVANHIIAQVALPKSYGNIVVRKKNKLPFSGIRGLTKVSMEWNDFNNRYEVWASDMERVTSFELLNPAFMVYLQELPIEINMEVVDNIVYLYGTKVASTAENYAILLTVVQKAFKEMRM